MKQSTALLIGLGITVFLFSGNAHSGGGDIDKGKTLYLKYCETCHGQEGKGDGYIFFQPPVADLTSPKIQQKLDKELWKSIHMGVPGTVMGMWRFVLSDEEIDNVLAYVRSLAREPDPYSRKLHLMTSPSIHH